MAYKRYFFKNGKIYGPYYYESYRDKDGKVRKRYVGVKDFKERKNYLLVSVLIFFFVISFLYLISLSKEKIVGKSILELSSISTSKGILEGALFLNLKEGELLPSNSYLVFEQEGKKEKILIKDLVQMNEIEGNFYIEGLNLSGEGKGFGVEGKKKLFPYVYFTLLVNKSLEKSREETPEEN
ncbi:MAG: hypothetical protein QW273_01380, partial [Candidatus Pacearchaeota archaeon]